MTYFILKSDLKQHVKERRWVSNLVLPEHEFADNFPASDAKLTGTQESQVV